MATCTKIFEEQKKGYYSEIHIANKLQKDKVPTGVDVVHLHRIINQSSLLFGESDGIF